MAFDRQNMARVASASTGAQANWLYRTLDEIVVMLSPGYFNTAYTDLKVDDVIQVKNEEGYFTLSIVSSSKDGVVVDSILIGRSESLLFSASFNLQEPTTTDDPIQIEFGDGGTSPDGEVSLSSGGALTINKTDFYDITIFLEYNRQSSGGTTLTFFRILANGVQQGNSASVEANTSDQTIPLQFNFDSVFEAGTVITFEMYRDSTGFNDGELRGNLSSLGWNPSPSASLRVARL